MTVPPRPAHRRRAGRPRAALATVPVEPSTSTCASSQTGLTSLSGHAPPRTCVSDGCDVSLAERHANARYCSGCVHARTLAQQRKRYATDPEYRERKREGVRESQRKRHATDPEYRERVREQQRWRYATDPEYRERKREGVRESQRKRHATDPEYRERVREQQRERYATDPEYRERQARRLHDPVVRERHNARRRERNATDPEYRERRARQRRTSAP